MGRGDCDVAIVGGGPYGLAAAAHLRSAKGLETRVVGKPMSFWKGQMPRGMLLRSPWAASHISDPDGALTLDSYEASIGCKLTRPIPLEDFIAYGEWFQKQSVPGIQEREVIRIDVRQHRFRLALDDGSEFTAGRVIVATGIRPFAWWPHEFRGLSEELVSHSSDYGELGRHAGSRVIVIGRGQSALESAALLREAGAEVEVLVRSEGVHWLGRSARLHRLGPLTRLLYAPTDVGPVGVSHIVAAPGFLKRFPRGAQDWFRTVSTSPAAAIWVAPRLTEVKVTTGRTVVSATPSGDRLALRLDDGSQRLIDHVVLGTGYRADISNYTFLARELVEAIQRVDGYPCLDTGFESSVRGLHFLGTPAAWSFGPLMRFIAGTRYAASRVARRVMLEDGRVFFARRGFCGISRSPAAHDASNSTHAGRPSASGSESRLR